MGLKGNINLIFTNGDLGDVEAALDTEVRESPAKAGMIAPKDVTVPVGATGLIPNKQVSSRPFRFKPRLLRDRLILWLRNKLFSRTPRLIVPKPLFLIN